MPRKPDYQKAQKELLAALLRTHDRCGFSPETGMEFVVMCGAVFAQMVAEAATHGNTILEEGGVEKLTLSMSEDYARWVREALIARRDEMLKGRRH